jgi:hypothetical protein
MIVRMSAPGGARLGEILVQDAGLSQADLARGLALARSEHVRLGSALVGLGLVTADDVALALARQKGVLAARDKHLDAIAPETRRRLPAAIAQRLCAVPVGIVRGTPPELVVAMRDPDDAAAIAELARVTGHVIRPAVACEARLREIVDAMRDDAPAPATVAATPELPEVPELPELPQLPELIELTPIPGAPPVDAIAAPPASPLLVPALSLEPLPGDDDDDDGEPQGTPSRPIIIRSDDLELDAPAAAAAPRARRPSTMPVPTAPPVGAALLDDAPAPGARRSWALRLLAVAILAGVAVVTYDLLSGDDDGAAIVGTFHCARLGASLRLPGTGWREDGDHTETKLPMLGQATRGDLFVRDAPSGAPEQVALIIRVTQAGAFAHVDPASFDAAVSALEQSSSQIGGGLFALDGGLACHTDTLGASPLAVCDGKGQVMGESYAIRIFLWMPTADDALVAVWFDRGGRGDDAMTLVRSIRVE